MTGLFAFTKAILSNEIQDKLRSGSAILNLIHVGLNRKVNALRLRHLSLYDEWSLLDVEAVRRKMRVLAGNFPC